ncbi:hypothetical protein Tco_1366589, partial [Tanacetum coccineum]
MEGIGMHKAGFMQLGMQRRDGMLRETWIPMLLNAEKRWNASGNLDSNVVT